MPSPAIIPVSECTHDVLVQRALRLFPECADGLLCMAPIEDDVFLLDTAVLTGKPLLLVVPEDTQAVVSLSSTLGDAHIRAFVARQGNLQCVHIQKGEEPAMLTQRSYLEEGAHMRWQNLTLGSRVEHDVQSVLDGAHAESTVEWVFYAKKNERQNLSVRNVFNGRSGGGEMTLRGVAEDMAQVMCDGLIEIGLGGGGTDTYLTEEVLMLDPSAKVDAIPGLEIKTNDVKASHSATVSRVTEEDLFLFAARGIDESLARRMYVEGFLGGLIDALPDALKSVVREEIQHKYSAG